MTAIDIIQQEIIDEFSVFDDWMDRYQLIIDMSSDLPLIDAEHRTDKYIIDGCQSKVWLYAELKDGRMWISADSDAIITKGLVWLLVRIWNGQTPADIVASDPYFIQQIGLSQHLSPTRSNGLLAMIKQIKLYAAAFSRL